MQIWFDFESHAGLFALGAFVVGWGLAMLTGLLYQGAVRS